MKIALCGPGQSGKDTVAEMFVEQFGLRYKHSTSWYAKEYIYGLWAKAFPDKPYDSMTAFYNDRRNHRVFWAEAIDKMNATDAAFLYRLCLSSGEDILTGIRKKREFNAVVDAGLVDLTIWVQRFPLETGIEDPTQEYGSDLCDFTLFNHTDRKHATLLSVINLKRAFTNNNPLSANSLHVLDPATRRAVQ